MTDINTKLESFDNTKLIDIVKNYKQYGYDEGLRNIAIEILDKRGIDKEHLKLSGNFENQSYESAQRMYKSFSLNSKLAFILYIIALISNILILTLSGNSSVLTSTILIINWTALIAYFIFLIQSFMNQNRFYKIIGKESDSNGILIYVFLGLPFYIFTYFYFRNQMNEEMKTIV